MAFPELLRQGIDVVAYDPYYASDYPVGKFDTIICNYVLNVLLPEEQPQVLMAVSELLKPTGKAYFTVRRDIKQNGFRTHTKLGCRVYQCNVVLPYKSVMRNAHCEIYEYRHYNQQPVSTECVFCAPDSQRELVTESATVYAVLDKFPVNPGHTLIVPKQHCADYFELPERAKTACWLVLDRAKQVITERFQPGGFNVGINIGPLAGQTIPHVHIHLIPRYKGDVQDPTGGVRGVIPLKQNYLTSTVSTAKTEGQTPFVPLATRNANFASGE